MSKSASSFCRLLVKSNRFHEQKFPGVIGETYNVQHCPHIFNVVEILGGYAEMYYENTVISYVLTAHPCYLSCNHPDDYDRRFLVTARKKWTEII